MPKLTKQYYFKRNGERRINCYHINLSKDIINKTNIQEQDELKISVIDNKIIIEKSV